MCLACDDVKADKGVAEADSLEAEAAGSYEGLTALPGVGPKVAYCVLTVVFGQTDAGIVVDSNLHRLCNRLGICSGGDGAGRGEKGASLAGTTTYEMLRGGRDL